MTTSFAELTTAEDRFKLSIWRALRRGEVLSLSNVERLGTESGLDREAIASRLQTSSERDAEDRVIGFGGLSVGDHPHRLIFEDRELSAWCAWDPFFLVPALGGDATLETADPVSGQVFTVEFVGGRAEDSAGSAGAPTTVLSMVARPIARDAPAHEAVACDCGEDTAREQSSRSLTVEDLWASFCSHVHLFESERTAREFSDGRSFELLSLGEASALAEETYGQLIRAAQAGAR